MLRPWGWKCQVLPKWNIWQPSMALCDGRRTWGKRSQAPRVEGPPAISESRVRQRSSALIAEGQLAAAGAEHLSFRRSSPHTDLSGREKPGTTWRGEQTRSRNIFLAGRKGFPEEGSKLRETQLALTCHVSSFQAAVCHMNLGKCSYFPLHPIQNYPT